MIQSLIIHNNTNLYHTTFLLPSTTSCRRSSSHHCLAGIQIGTFVNIRIYVSHIYVSKPPLRSSSYTSRYLISVGKSLTTATPHTTGGPDLLTPMSNDDTRSTSTDERWWAAMPNLWVPTNEDEKSVPPPPPPLLTSEANYELRDL